MNEILKGLGFEYSMYPKMYGNPDFVLEEQRIAIFCDGDFWHGYNYQNKKKPSKKILERQDRDQHEKRCSNRSKTEKRRLVSVEILGT